MLNVALGPVTFPRVISCARPQYSRKTVLHFTPCLSGSILHAIRRHAPVVLNLKSICLFGGALGRDVLVCFTLNIVPASPSSIRIDVILIVIRLVDLITLDIVPAGPSSIRIDVILIVIRLVDLITLDVVPAGPSSV